MGFRPGFAILVAGLALMACTIPVRAQVHKLAMVHLSIGNYNLRAELADTDPSRSYGLMHRESLPQDQGMLFMFDVPWPQCFWMKNTPLPLSIAFITSQGVITNLEDMQPYTTSAHCSTQAVRYALEMEQGWFRERGIQAGQTVRGLPRPWQ